MVCHYAKYLVWRVVIIIQLQWWANNPPETGRQEGAPPSANFCWTLQFRHARANRDQNDQGRIAPLCPKPSGGLRPATKKDYSANFGSTWTCIRSTFCSTNGHSLQIRQIYNKCSWQKQILNISFFGLQCPPCSVHILHQNSLLFCKPCG